MVSAFEHGKRIPFDNQDTLISTLLTVWTSVLYQTRPDPGAQKPPCSGNDENGR
jgi:hypothetical protein